MGRGERRERRERERERGGRPYFPHVGCSQEGLARSPLHGRLQHLCHAVLGVGGVVVAVHRQSDVVSYHLLQWQGPLFPTTII